MHFNNPFQSSQNAHAHYQLEDDRDDQPPTLGGKRLSNQQTPLGGRSEEVVIDFRPNMIESVATTTQAISRDPGGTTATMLDMTEPNVPPQRDHVSEQKTLETMIRELMMNVLKCGILYSLGFVVAFSTIKWSFSYIYLFLFFWLCNAYNIIVLSHHLASAPKIQKRIDALQIANHLISAGFKVLLVIQIETKALSITVPLIPVIIFELFTSVVKLCYNRKNCTAIYYKVEVATKILIILQVITLGLKLDNMLDWNWREVFWAYWLLFAIMVGISFAFILVFMGKFCAYMFAEMELMEVRGVLWLFGIIGGTTIFSCMLISQILNVLEGSSSIESLTGLMLTIAMYSLGVAIYTGTFFSGLEGLWKKVAATTVPVHEEEDILSEVKEHETEKKEPEKVDIPKFLTKFSGTYFRRATGDEIQKVKDSTKKKKEPVESKDNKGANKKAKAPRKMRARRNSLDTSKIRNSQSNTTGLNLLTDGDKTKMTTDWHNTSRFGLREDKGKDFFNVTDRTGVSGIIPSVMTSKTDRFQVEGLELKDYSPLASNDSYILPPISKDTDAPFRPIKLKDKNSISQSPGITSSNTPQEHSPLNRVIAISKNEEGDLSKLRRVQSMTEICIPDVISLSQALESPKVKCSVRLDHPEPLISPKSDGSTAVQCLICFDNPPDAVFMECGHGGVCYECSLEIWKSTNECYLCRNKITQVLQVDIKSKLENNVIKVLSSTQMVLYEEEIE